MTPPKNASRCGWATTPLGIAYHDEEWGVPVHDDQRLFEFLILEGAGRPELGDDPPQAAGVSRSVRPIRLRENREIRRQAGREID